MRTPAFALSLLSLTICLPGQGALRGNGFPAAYVETSPAVIGGQLQIGLGSPSQPNGFAVLSLSGGFTTWNLPLPQLGGPIALDITHPAYQVLLYTLDAQGHASVNAPIPANPALLASPSFYVNNLTFETAPLWSISKTAHIDYMLPDAWEGATAMGEVRQLHTATSLAAGPRDNFSEVLICGGATGSFIIPVSTATAELFSPVTRATTPLPNMSAPRSSHETVRLQDGRLLVTGGVSTGGVVLASCEFFDPDALTFSPAPAMSTGRAGHRATVLNDGRVLVTGGVSDWQNAAAQFIQALNTAQETAEIFDPSTNSWTQLPIMASKRLGHSQTILQNGQVLIASGIKGGYAGQLGGGQVPIYAASCQIFDPLTNSFSNTGDLLHTTGGQLFPPQTWTGRAQHGACLLPNGNVLITGGFVATQPVTLSTNDETIATRFCDIWDVNTGTWSVAPELPVAQAMHQSVPHNGGMLLCGGYTGLLANLASTSETVFHDGASVTTLAPMGIGRAAHTMTRLVDGTLLVYGGGDVWPNTLATGEIYLPN